MFRQRSTLARTASTSAHALIACPCLDPPCPVHTYDECQALEKLAMTPDALHGPSTLGDVLADVGARHLTALQLIMFINETCVRWV